DLVGGAALAARALEDLREARRDALDVLDYLRLGAAVVFARDTDDAAGVDHVVRRVQDAGGAQRLAVLAERQLVVGRARDHRHAQPRDRAGGEDCAERARRQYVGLFLEHLRGGNRRRLELIGHALDRARYHIRDLEARARGREHPAQVITDAARALHRDREPG